MTPSALGELRCGGRGTGALRRAGISPCGELVDLCLRKALVVLESAVVRIGEPGWHFARCHFGLDGARPRPRLLVGKKRHRRNLVGPMTFDATAIQDGCNVLVVSRGCAWRLRRRLRRIQDGDPQDDSHGCYHSARHSSLLKWKG